MTFRDKLIKERTNITYEKLDKTPLAILTSGKEPETLSSAIARVLDHSLSEEEWQRVRGVEYDFNNSEEFDDDEYEGEFENGDIEHDPKGHYEENYKAEKEKAKKEKESKNAKKEIDNNNRDNSDSGNSDRGTSEEPTE